MGVIGWFAFYRLQWIIPGHRYLAWSKDGIKKRKKSFFSLEDVLGKESPIDFDTKPVLLLGDGNAAAL